MIISRTPFRISFFGGGSDYPVWYLREGGAVLSATINRYCYISCRYLPPLFEVKHRIVWSHIETVSALAEVLHPAVREGLQFLGFNDELGLEIHHQGDLPARSGIGSSSAFCVGLIKALTALRGEKIGKHELALKAIELEQVVLKEHVGSQDQVAAAYGGLNMIRFEPDGSIHVEPVELGTARIRELESRLMLFYSGRTRLASQVAGGVIAALPSKSRELREMRRMVDRAVAILRGGGDLDAFGRLLHDGWFLKRQLSDDISNSRVERVYAKAMEAGALGGKLLGAGAAGFMLFYVPPERQDAVRSALADHACVPIGLESEGSSIIYEDPEAPVGVAPPRRSPGDG